MCQSTLYNTPTLDRFYRLPADQTLPEGTDLIRTLDGEQHRTDAVALAPFEITLAQAKELLLEQMDPLLEELGRLVKHYHALSVLEARAEGKTPITEIPVDDVDAAKERLSPMLEALGTFFQQATSDDPQEQAAAQEKLRAFRADLAQAGIPTSERLERMPERLREAKPESLKVESRGRVAAAFQELFETISTVAEEAGQELRERMDELEERRPPQDTSSEL